MIPHIEQKHNNNQTSLQHLGNLAYRQGKTTPSYDSINSLTTPNNYYTLLYPDLVQELFDLSLHNSNSTTNNSPFLRSVGVNNTKYSSLDSSISSSLDSLLSPRDILFFLQIVSLYQLELSKGNTSITYPSLKLAKLLGVDASCDTTHLTANTHNSVNSLTDSNMRATILKMTAKLESLGLMKVFRSKRSNGMDKANTLIPVLPDRLHAKLQGLPANLKVCDSSKSDHESNLEHILRTKLFVPIELEFMKSLFRNNLPSKYKLFFLNCIMSAYRNFRHNFCSSDILSFSSTSSELIRQNNISKRTLFNIFKYIKQQGDSFFLKVEHKYTKSDDIDCNRYDKSIFVISINPLVFPISHICQSKEKEISNINQDETQGTNTSIFLDNYKGFREGVQKKQPSSAKKTALNNKEIIIKESNKNIDVNLSEKNEELDKLDKNNQIKPQTFLQTSNSEHLESELCSLSSKSLKNSIKAFIDTLPSPSNSNTENASSTIQDISNRSNKTNTTNKYTTVIPKQTAPYSTNIVIHKTTATQAKAINDRKHCRQHQDLRYFYPISEEDSNMLNFKANREFDTNFTNQLLLKLYIKYPEKKFKNKFTFSDYMIKTLKGEKHQGPLVNNPSFRFSCNIGKEEKNLLEYERYLSQIENSFDTSKEMCVKKKIAGRFSTELAYAILTGVELKTNSHNSFITALIPSSLALSERQVATLSDQLEAVYGINGYYIQELEAAEKLLTPEFKTKNTNSIKTSISFAEPSNGKETTEEHSAWHQIRKTLREELGDHIDQAWFAKTVATECKDTKILTLTMPTRFMSDWVRNNYSHVIRRVAGSVGVKMVEYSYD